MFSRYLLRTSLKFSFPMFGEGVKSNCEVSFMARKKRFAGKGFSQGNSNVVGLSHSSEIYNSYNTVALEKIIAAQSLSLGCALVLGRFTAIISSAPG